MVTRIIATAFGILYLFVGLFMALFFGLMAQGVVLLILKHFGIEL